MRRIQKARQWAMANEADRLPKKGTEARQKWIEDFCRILEETGSIKQTCRLMDINRANAYRNKAEDEIFAEAWDTAFQCHIDQLEHSLLKRAVEGVREPIFHKAKIVGAKVRYSDSLGMFFLKKHRPGKYGDKPVGFSKEEIAQLMAQAVISMANDDQGPDGSDSDESSQLSEAETEEGTSNE